MRSGLADRVAEARRVWQIAFHRALDRGWHEQHEGFTALVSGIPAPPFNGLTVDGEHDPAELAETLDRVATSGLPFGVLARPAQIGRVADLLAARGMERQAPMPVMALTQPPPEPAVPGLTIREIAPQEGDLHAVIAAEAFGGPIELMRQLTTPQLLVPPTYTYVGFVDETPVSTALVMVSGESGHIVDVATVAGQRGHGFGAALTAMAARRAFHEGAAFCFLSSTPPGLGVYTRLGFETVEQSTSWAGFPE